MYILTAVREREKGCKNEDVKMKDLHCQGRLNYSPKNTIFGRFFSFAPNK